MTSPYYYQTKSNDNNRKVQLSRLSITGHVHENTPMCVLSEIADAHGISYGQKDLEGLNFAHHLLNSIYQTKVASLGEVKDTSEWRHVATFVNKYSQWPLGKLTEAYNFIMLFVGSDDPLPKIPINFVVGLQTPSNPTAINACILYKTCMHYRLNVNTRTTINQMANAVRMLREDTESIIRKAEIFIGRDAKRVDLINTLMLSVHEIKDPDPPIINNIDETSLPKVDVCHHHLLAMHQALNDVVRLRELIDPTTYTGCIALAAINYNIDISKSTSPSREYKILRVSGRGDYRPIDPWMKYWYQRIPGMFDLSVTFNPLFPPQFYDNNRMICMVQNEGYTNVEIANNDPYELLQLAYVGETFYQGERPNMKSNMTSVALDDISDIPYGQLLCFGQLDSPLKPISMNEIIELFNTNQNFSTPFDACNVFSDIAINKLKLIAQSPYGPNTSIALSEETVAVRNQLFEAINSIEMLTRSNDEPTRQLAFSYRNADPDTKQAIRNTLTQLLYVGMYMRGWMGTDEYPVIKATVPPERESQVAINVTKSMAEYESSCRSLGKIGTLINNLPLVLYRDKQYHVSVSSSHGYTVGERINIVKQGDRTENVASCIRLSSNWICSSAHKYIMAVGLPAPFDIFNLRHIS